MTAAVAKAGDGATRMGRPPKLTPEVRAALIEAFELGAPQSVACAVARISVSTYQSWMQRAKLLQRGEPSPEGVPSNADILGLLEDIQAAESRNSLTLLGSVKTTVVGRFCNVCTDGIYKGKICPVCKGTEEARRPDGKLALAVLERRHSEFRKPDPTMHVEQHITGSVDINVSALTMDLATMTPEQLMALTGGEERDAIEAEEVDDE